MSHSSNADQWEVLKRSMEASTIPKPAFMKMCASFQKLHTMVESLNNLLVMKNTIKNSNQEDLGQKLAHQMDSLLERIMEFAMNNLVELIQEGEVKKSEPIDVETQEIPPKVTLLPPEGTEWSPSPGNRKPTPLQPILSKMRSSSLSLVRRPRAYSGARTSSMLNEAAEHSAGTSYTHSMNVASRYSNRETPRMGPVKCPGPRNAIPLPGSHIAQKRRPSFGNAALRPKSSMGLTSRHTAPLEASSHRRRLAASNKLRYRRDRERGMLKGELSGDSSRSDSERNDDEHRYVRSTDLSNSANDIVEDSRRFVDGIEYALGNRN